jgi:hypothetical protein
MVGSKRLAVLALSGTIPAVLLLAHPTVAAAAPAAATVPVGSGMGVTFNQVDYNWDTSAVVDSGTGEINVVLATLTGATGISSGFLNVGTSNGWVVQNLPIDPTDDPYATITSEFELDPSDGTAITAENADVEFSASPVTSFSTGATQSFAVGDANYDGSGFGAAGTSGPEAPPAPGVVSFTGGPAFTFCFQIAHPNIEAADNQCGPASVANSFTWLKTQYGLAIPDNNVLGFCDNTSLVGKLDTLMGRCSGRTFGDGRTTSGSQSITSPAMAQFSGGDINCSITGSGIPANTTITAVASATAATISQAATATASGVSMTITPTRRCGPALGGASILRGKLTYLANNNLGNAVVVKHQANGQGVGGGDFMAAGLTSHGNGATPTASFITSEVCAGEDVELGFTYPRGGGHFVELTGAGSILGVPWITYLSDHDQTNDASGTTKIDFSFLRDTDADGLLNLVNEGGVPNAQIVLTESLIAQSNVPEFPAAASLLPIGVVLLLAMRYRRRGSGETRT